MQGAYLEEPELEFAHGRHIDIRCGLTALGALDSESDTAPVRVRLGLVGDSDSIGGFSRWISKCRKGVERKKGNLHTLFPSFPGFGEDRPLCDFVVTDQLTRSIPGYEIRSLSTVTPRSELVSHSVDRYLSDAVELYHNTPCDVVICLLPAELLKPIDTGAQQHSGPRSRRHKRNEDEHKVVWHDLLKARAMNMKGPIQMVRPATYGGKVHRFKQDGTSTKDVEDEATRAWNFFTALYYKAGGVPWRLPRKSSDYDTCYVGVSYFHSPDQSTVQTSVAQVFNERGEGVVVRGGQALVKKEDKSLHMDKQTAESLLRNALVLYKREHCHMPARIVCHKSSYFDEDERDGFLEVARQMGIDLVDLLSIRRSSARFFRAKPNPVLRGTAVEIEDGVHVLYTQGSVDFYRAYPGLYVPRPIEVHLDCVESHADKLLTEILALTKMNWNSTRFVNSEPITLSAARTVGDVLRYADAEQSIPARYSYYM